MRRIPESELIINSDGSVFHLHLRPEQLADKVVLDGSSKKSKTEIKDYLEQTVAKQYAYRVVKYALNAEGKIIKRDHGVQ